MTDAQFQRALDIAHRAHENYLVRLKVVEDEYERRFGFHPSNGDDDMWIDTMHGGNPSHTTVESVTLGATKYASANSNP